MEKIKRFFKEIKWYEYLFVGVCLTIFVTLSVVFKSSIITTLSAILGFWQYFLSQKVMSLGRFWACCKFLFILIIPIRTVIMANL